jgi:hypothetical protein
MNSVIRALMTRPTQTSFETGAVAPDCIYNLHLFLGTQAS